MSSSPLKMSRQANVGLLIAAVGAVVLVYTAVAHQEASVANLLSADADVVHSGNVAAVPSYENFNGFGDDGAHTYRNVVAVSANDIMVGFGDDGVYGYEITPAMDSLHSNAAPENGGFDGDDDGFLDL